MPLDLSTHTILVVEDEGFSRAILVRMLSAMGSPTIHQATNGEEAMQYLWTVPQLSFVISDLNMPVVNGLQVLKGVRSGRCGVDRALPFAMLTGYSDKNLVDAALKLDVNSFVIKPVSKEALEKRLARLLRSTRDTAWLKAVEMYQHVDTKISVQPLSESERDAQRERDEAVARLSAEIALVDRGGKRADRSASDAAPRRRRSGKFTDAELAGASGKRFTEAEIARTAGQSVVSRLSSLRGRFKDSDLAGDIAAGIGHLVAEVGDKGAADIVGVLDSLERSGALSLGDIAGVLGTPLLSDSGAEGEGPWTEELLQLGAVPIGSQLARDIKTRDGEVFIRSGIRMSRLIISLLVHLDGLNALALADGSVHVRVQQAAPGGLVVPPGKAREVSVDDIPEGAILARGIYTVDGNLYLPAGSTMTPRIVALIQDLRDLEKLNQPVWIVN